MRVITKHTTWVVPFFALCTVLYGCSSLSGEAATEVSANAQWKESGTVVLSRVAPPVTTGSEAATLMGFLPMQLSQKGRWLAIDTRANTARIMEGELAVTEVRAEGLGQLKPGVYQVIHKQKNPVWYAPDSYFTSRLQPVPVQGSKERFRKGALGDAVLYFDPQVPVHSAQLQSEEVGGVRLSSAEMSRLYDSLDIGSQVEIK